MATDLRHGHVFLPHSLLSDNAVHIGKTDENEVVKVVVHLRRRPGHDPIPSFHEFVGCPPRPHLSEDEFSARYGASQSDIDDVKAAYLEHGLEVVGHRAVSRQVTLAGTVGQFNAAFGTETHTYEKTHSFHGTYQFRHHGPIQVPGHLGQTIVAITGISTEHRAHPTVAQPASTQPFPNGVLTPQKVSTLYNVPTNLASGQTIGIWGWNNSSQVATDTTQTLNNWVVSAPNITNIYIGDSTKYVNGSPDDLESVLDISTCAAYGQGAALVVYFADVENSGTYFQDTLQRMIHPPTGDPVCTILSFSFEFAIDAGPSDPIAVASEPLFQDAAMKGITVLFSSGDTGSTFQGANAVAVTYPASSPWVTSVGGTILGTASGATSTISPTNFVEWVWDDQILIGANGNTTTGGGISKAFPVPSYQANAGLPTQLTTGFHGRGVPDIAGNASIYSGSPMFAKGGQSFTAGGTSSSAPMYAGIFARINASLGHNMGFINPTLYTIGTGTALIRDITTSTGGAVDNHYGSIPGYPVGTGWDACTGLGVINGGNFLNYLKTGVIAVSGVTATSYQLTNLSVGRSYYFQVQAANGAGTGVKSAMIGPIVPVANPSAPPPTPTESADQTTEPPAIQIVDASHNVWTITSGKQVAKNSVVDTTTNSVTELAYAAHVLWQLNTSGDWYSWTGTAWSGPTKTSPLTPPPTPTPTPTGALPYMVGYGGAGAGSDPANTTIEGWWGRANDLVTTTISMAGSMATNHTAGPVGNNRATGYVVSFPMLDIFGDQSSAKDMAAAARGDYDTFYTAMLNTLKSRPNPIIGIRPGWECNGTWYLWSNGVGTNATYANYIATFKRIGSLCKQILPNALVELCGVWGFSDVTPYFPGAYNASTNPGGCDVISVDVYNANVSHFQNGDNQAPWSGAQNYSGLSNPPNQPPAMWHLDYLVQFARNNGIKVGLTEYGPGAAWEYTDNNGAGSGGEGGYGGIPSRGYSNDANWATGCINWINAQGNIFVYSIWTPYTATDDMLAAGVSPAVQNVWKTKWGSTHFDRTVSGWWKGALVPSESAVAPTPTPTTPTPTESADRTAIPSATQIVDANHAIWTLASAQVLKNGTIDTSTHNVSSLAYVSHVVWQETDNFTPHVWYSWSGTAWSAGTTASPLAVPTPTPTPTPPTPTPTPPVGAIPYMIGYGGAGAGRDPSNSKIEAWFGRANDIVTTTVEVNGYVDGPFTSGAVGHNRASAFNTSFPMLNLNNVAGYNMADLAAAANGSYDSIYTAMLNSLKGVPNPIAGIRPGWECNGNWYPWSNGVGTNATYANYIATFKRIAMLCRQILPGTMVELCGVWGFSDVTPYFPGAYNAQSNPGGCDVISLDVYNATTSHFQNGDNLATWLGAQNYSGLSSPPAAPPATWHLDYMVSFARAHGVRVGLTEYGPGTAAMYTGAGQGGEGGYGGVPAGGYSNDGAWTNACIDWINSLGNLFVYSVWTPYTPSDDLLASGVNPAEQAAWKSKWGNTHFDRTLGGWWTGRQVPSEP